MPSSDGLPRGMGGIFGRRRFDITGGRMSLEGKQADFFHSEGTPAPGPVPDGRNGRARAGVGWAFIFKIFEHARGLIRRFEPKEFMIIRITPKSTVFGVGFFHYPINGESAPGAAPRQRARAWVARKMSAGRHATRQGPTPMVEDYFVAETLQTRPPASGL